jgi:hypothetical protein
VNVPWRMLIVAAGIGQLALAAGSLAIPRVLRWPEDLERVRPLTRQVFWTYAGYIWTTNVAMGLVSALRPSWLLDGSPLAGAVCGYIAVYWGARLAIQFVYFDRTEAPKGVLFAIAEAALVGLFLCLCMLYGAMAARHLGWLGS